MKLGKKKSVVALSTISSIGKVTLPKEVLESMSLKAGDQIEITLSDGSAILRPLSKKVEDVFGMLQAEGQRTLRIEEMDKAVAQKFHSSER